MIFSCICSGTGALAIFLRRSFGVDITTSDFDDKEIEDNIAHNCRVNELPVLPHIRRMISSLQRSYISSSSLKFYRLLTIKAILMQKIFPAICTALQRSISFSLSCMPFMMPKYWTFVILILDCELSFL